MDIVKGQIVTSKAGRDVTQSYVVLDVQGSQLLLADGRKRTVKSPKRKNIRHVQPTRTVLPPGETDTDIKLRAALSEYEPKAGARKQGGEKLV